MKNLSDLLQRFKNFTPPDEAVKREAAKIILEEAGISVLTVNISVSGTALHIKASPAERGEIMLHKERIEGILMAALGLKKPYQLR